MSLRAALTRVSTACEALMPLAEIVSAQGPCHRCLRSVPGASGRVLLPARISPRAAAGTSPASSRPSGRRGHDRPDGGDHDQGLVQDPARRRLAVRLGAAGHAGLEGYLAVAPPDPGY